MFNKDIIIELLNERGWTPYRLCQESKMAQSTLSDILTGKRKNPTARTLQKIATALGVSVDIFFTNDGFNSTESVETEKNIETESAPKKFSPEIETIAAHLDDKNITPKKLKMIQDYIDLLFDDEE